MPFSLVPLLLLTVPLCEIAVFILVGGRVGIGWTLGLVMATAALGSILLRVQGLQLVAAIRREMDAGRAPGRELVHGAMVAVAGLLLLTPGFVTDTVGFLLFFPPLRETIWTLIRNRTGVATGRSNRGGRPAIDLDREDFHRNNDPSSAGKER